MRTHQKPGLEGLGSTLGEIIEEAAGRGGVEQSLHESHAGRGIAGAGDVENLVRVGDIQCVITDNTRPRVHRAPLHFLGVAEGPAGVRHSCSTSLFLQTE